MARLHHLILDPLESFVRPREAALAAVAIQEPQALPSHGLPLNCFAEFTPDYDPGLAMMARAKHRMWYEEANMLYGRSYGRK